MRLLALFLAVLPLCASAQMPTETQDREPGQTEGSSNIEGDLNTINSNNGETVINQGAGADASQQCDKPKPYEQRATVVLKVNIRRCADDWLWGVIR